MILRSVSDDHKAFGIVFGGIFRVEYRSSVSSGGLIFEEYKIASAQGQY